ncbi:MAG: glucose-6-phosphate dehydrogenase [Caldilineaceae bacterium]|nr:glucose-6-phosphate dehydrogenase [Caldilineaceae bacterium]
MTGAIDMRMNLQPALLVVYGASGDLSKRKLIPALYELARQNLLPKNFTLVGYARSSFSDQEFRELAHDSVRQFGASDFDQEVWESFAAGIFYQSGAYDSAEDMDNLGLRIAELDEARGTSHNHLFYLATPPNVVEPITTLISKCKLCRPSDVGERRIVIEKPFGRDLASAQRLNRHLQSLFSEDQIFRIDHYLGKETVQNILVFRFGNGIFEPIWNRNYIDHVQITVAESIGIGSRAGYYDKSGAIRDMVQNHVMQLVALTAMEPPVAIDAKAVRDQKVNVLRSICQVDSAHLGRSVVRAQYSPGVAEGEVIPGYLETEGVAPDSTTDTFLAWKLQIENWRWNGVPFYIRSGKALAEKLTEINIVFRKPPMLLFQDVNGDRDFPKNMLTMRVQPNEGIRLGIEAKRPGLRLDVAQVGMDFFYTSSFGAQPGDAYERLLLDAIQGDGTLFIRHDETEAAWELVTQVLDGWQQEVESVRGRKEEPFRLPQYAAGSWGPPEADYLIRQDGRYWRNSHEPAPVG